jgi:hypothetical protein
MFAQVHAVPFNSLIFTGGVMIEEMRNLDKLKLLCDELTNRDQQLKLNAATLWEILEVISGVSESLSKINIENPEAQERVGRCVLELEEISCIITRKGCKKVGSSER